MLLRLLKSKKLHRDALPSYRRFINRHYDGCAGWLTYATGFLSGHSSLSHQLFNEATFGIRGRKMILDVGCGNGRYLKALRRYADRDATLIGVDLSLGMLRRARNRMSRLYLASADLAQLPFAPRTFDAIVCGWVLEHLSDPRTGLQELSRILKPDGRILLLTTEDTFAGAICSRFYHCRTYQRSELRDACLDCRLLWHRDLWWSRLHRLLHLGGIVAELRLDSASVATTAANTY